MLDGLGTDLFSRSSRYLARRVGVIATRDAVRNNQKKSNLRQDRFLAFFVGSISFRYRSRRSLSVVDSDSDREPKIPLAISDSTTAAQSSASAQELKVFRWMG